MSKEEEKQLKLIEVSKQLSQLKNQLQQLMRPLPEKVDHGATVKLDWTSIRNKIEMQKTQRKTHEKTTAEKEKEKSSGSKWNHFPSSFKPIHIKTLNSPRQGINIDPNESNLLRNKSIESSTLKTPDLNGIKSELKFKEQARFMPKLKLASQRQDYKVKGNHSSQRKGPSLSKKINHGRHNTQYEIERQPKVSPSNHKLHTDHGKISEKSLLEVKPLVANRKNPELDKGKNKKLKRMKSDFTGQKNLKEQTVGRDSEQSDRVLELEEEVKKKDQIIAFLTSELQQIDRSFKILEQNLKNMLGRHTHFKAQLTDLEINQAMKVIVKELQDQQAQIERYQKECERLKLAKEEQDVVIRVLQEKFIEVQRIVADPQPQKIHFLGQLKTLSCKLQLAISENKMKDEFIVNILTLRNKAQQSPSQQLNQLLAKYLQKCQYPSNRLLEKLTEEEAEIHKLREMLGKSH